MGDQNDIAENLDLQGHNITKMFCIPALHDLEVIGKTTVSIAFTQIFNSDKVVSLGDNDY